MSRSRAATERRAFQSLVIRVEGDEGPAAQQAFASYRGSAPESLSDDDVRALLLESGLWTAFRTRPYSRVPPADAVPAAIFVTAMDTRPHAPAPERVLASRGPDFEAGVAAIALATINMFGGFAVTRRMLEMFRK